MSRLFLTTAAFALVTASAAAPAFPAAAASPAAIAACLTEAQWPITHAAAYADGSARTREVLLNSYNPAVGHFSSLCRRIATAPAGDRVQANIDCRRDAADDKSGITEAARAHLARMASRCAALAN